MGPEGHRKGSRPPPTQSSSSKNQQPRGEKGISSAALLISTPPPHPQPSSAPPPCPQMLNTPSSSAPSSAASSTAPLTPLPTPLLTLHTVPSILLSTHSNFPQPPHFPRRSPGPRILLGAPAPPILLGALARAPALRLLRDPSPSPLPPQPRPEPGPLPPHGPAGRRMLKPRDLPGPAGGERGRGGARRRSPHPRAHCAAALEAPTWIELGNPIPPRTPRSRTPRSRTLHSVPFTRGLDARGGSLARPHA
ncbi:vegetative cell wall protein gp1-like [Trichosurus vulpecula]|uniref:vegetative cell wall protein gp1-like n=1 Tax=Trichosurus vulpecula TaxID=9337 RepID=UPI00186ABC22|nr:vegetative cell wall protein gp1-like [Trichosurus vulpecula]